MNETNSHREATETFGNWITSVTDIVTDVLEIVPGYYAFKRTFKETVTKDQKDPVTTEKVEHGLCDAEGLSNLKENNGKALFNDIPLLEGKYGTFPELINKNMLEQIHKTGMHAFSTPQWKKEAITNPKWFDYFQEGGSVENVIRFRNYDHAIFTLTGEVLPMGIHFDYIDAGMRSGIYNLDKVAEILSQRDDITFTYEGTRFGENKPVTPYLIPYYNNESGKEKMLSFFFSPTKEQMKLIRKERDEKKKRLVEVVLEHDMLGIACARHKEEITFTNDDDDY